MTTKQRTILPAALLLISLSAFARKEGSRNEDAGSGLSDRERAIELRDRKPEPAATPQPVASPVVTSTPEEKPKKAEQRDEKRERKKDKSGKNNSESNVTPPEPEAAPTPEPQKRKKGKGKPAVETPEIVPDDGAISTEPLPSPTPEGNESTLHSAPVEEGEAPVAEYHQRERKRPRERRGDEVEVTGSPTPFIPAGTPPASAGTPSGTASQHVQPKPTRAPATPKPKKEKKKKPAPTPGPTPVPTPAKVTPTPSNFKPTPQWNPPPGWVPPPGWKPPKGWAPPGGWTVPAGWKPPKGWELRLFSWGWCYVPGRGWVIPPRWTPPPTFRCPPGWYHLPREEYPVYDLYDPVDITIVTGIGRPDLVHPVPAEEPYTPSEEIAEEITDEEADEGEEQDEEMETPSRPAPDEPPGDSPSEVDTIVETLTRERDAENRYRGPIVSTQRVQFEDDSYAILPQSFTMLNAIGEALLEPELEDAVLSIESHLNGRLDDAQAQELTEHRAWSVKGYLVQKFGIDPNRLKYIGYGNAAPIAPHATDDGLAMNERLEFENVSDLFDVEEMDAVIPVSQAEEFSTATVSGRTDETSGTVRIADYGTTSTSITSPTLSDHVSTPTRETLTTWTAVTTSETTTLSPADPPHNGATVAVTISAWRPAQFTPTQQM